MVKDPEYPAQSFRAEMSGKLLQLQESWQTLNNTLSNAEADRILKTVFPDEP